MTQAGLRVSGMNSLALWDELGVPHQLTAYGMLGLARASRARRRVHRRVRRRAPCVVNHSDRPSAASLPRVIPGAGSARK
jgi:hypothetical protein